MAAERKWDKVKVGDIVSRMDGPNKGIRLEIVKIEKIYKEQLYLTCKAENPKDKLTLYYKLDKEDGMLHGTQSCFKIIEIKPTPKKRWAQMTEADLKEVKTKKCRLCPYRGGFNSKNIKKGIGGEYQVSDLYCNYLCITGKMRETDIFECTHDKDDVKEVNRLKKINAVDSNLY